MIFGLPFIYYHLVSTWNVSPVSAYRSYPLISLTGHSSFYFESFSWLFTLLFLVNLVLTTSWLSSAITLLLLCRWMAINPFYLMEKFFPPLHHTLVGGFIKPNSEPPSYSSQEHSFIGNKIQTLCMPYCIPKDFEKDQNIFLFLGLDKRLKFH